MGFGAAVSSVLSKYAGFQGRARRSEYWWWILAYILVLVIAGVADNILQPPVPGALFQSRPVTDLIFLAVIVPTLAVTVRRLHDTDRSGFWVFIGVIPIIGWLVLLYWYCLRGTAGSNNFGPDPAT